MKTKYFAAFGLISVAIGCLISAGFAQGRPATARTFSFPNTTCSWNIVSSPNTGMPVNILRGATVVSASDIWAVGDAGNNGEMPSQTLIEHWNGAAWTIVPSPPPGGSTAALRSVAENSTQDVWAVGEVDDNTLTEHWNGKRWEVIPSPSKTVNGQQASNVLTGVVALAPDDVWAVGYAATITVAETLVLHWNGTIWSIVPSPSPGEGNGFFDDRLLGVTAVRGVTGLSADVWAAGESTMQGEEHNLIEHGDGATWSVIPSPHFPNTNVDFMQSICAISATDIWAAGAFSIPNAEGSPLQTAILHWDGTSWTIVPSPSPSSNFDVLNGVGAISSDDVWGVGSYDTTTGDIIALIEHWDGASWSVFPSPTGQSGSELTTVAAVSSADVWSVGEQAGQTLIERFTCQSLKR